MDSITGQSHPHGPEPRHPYAPEVQTNNGRLCERTDKPLSHSTCCTFSLFCPTFNQANDIKKPELPFYKVILGSNTNVGSLTLLVFCISNDASVGLFQSWQKEACTPLLYTC